MRSRTKKTTSIKLTGGLGLLSVAAAASGAGPVSTLAVEPSAPTTTPVTPTNLSSSRTNLRRRRGPNIVPDRSKYDLVSAPLGGGDNCPGTVIPPGTYSATAPFIDTGNTTGANNTIRDLCIPYYCYFAHSAGGPDLIYSFRVTAHGPNPSIQVTATSPMYQPMIYLTVGSEPSTCPAGTGNMSYYWNQFATAPQPGGTAEMTISGPPLNTPIYLFIDSPVEGPNMAGAYTMRLQDVSVAPISPTVTKKRFDFDADGADDLAVFRPSDRVWYLNRTSQGFYATQFGLPTDKLVPFNFNGDQKTDIAVYREGTWYLFDLATNTASVRQFGLANDIPVPADYTGDGLDELAIYRDGTWWMLNQFTGEASVVQFGLPGDKLVVGDYDGDGRADQAVYRAGQWHLNRSAQGYAVMQFGLPNDRPVTGDYDGDRISDLAVYRGGTWYLQRSTAGFGVIQFGLPTDIPVPGDYDGDGRTDIAVYRDGIWYTYLVGSGTILYRYFGLAGDAPIPAAYLP